MIGTPGNYNRYTTGNKVYGGGRNYATAGQVDPTGYADRERRSGLAKSMLHGSAGSRPPEAMLGETAHRLPAHMLARIMLARRGGMA